ncbi:MAG: hypothetical protein R3Y63_03560 [Eubacteriales bacterium]
MKIIKNLVLTTTICATLSGKEQPPDFGFDPSKPADEVTHEQMLESSQTSWS